MKVLANLIARGWCTGFAKWAGMNAAAPVLQEMGNAS